MRRKSDRSIEESHRQHSGRAHPDMFDLQAAVDRRSFLQATAAAGAATLSGFSIPTLAQTTGLDLPAALPDGVRASATLDVLPGKKPLIKPSYRPPNYETPIEYFREPITKLGSAGMQGHGDRHDRYPQ
jgi:hypothetical protein